jgi:HEAT repeat protein
MNTPQETDPASQLRKALSQKKSSQRLQVALAVGSDPQPDFIEVLIERCAVEPDFYVRDTLTWAITRFNADATVPLLLHEVTHGLSQARSQALHTLSKIGDPAGWAAIDDAILRDADDEVARAAWRAAVTLAPQEKRTYVAEILVSQLGRGDRDVQLSLSRAIIALGEDATSALTHALTHGKEKARIHAHVTERMIRYPEEGFEAALHEAKKTIILAKMPHDE